MNNIDKAIKYLESLEPGEQFVYREVADKYGCSRSALSRRWRGVSRDKATYDGQQQALHPQQERELVEYICELHKQGLAPTREMIQNFGSEIAGRAVSMS
jgi:transposase-like protein